MKIDIATGKTTYSAPCGVKGCIDYNLTITEGIERYNRVNGTRFDPLRPRDVAVFHLGNGFMGPTTSRDGDCECEIRGGGNLVSPLHIHHCAQHGGKPLGWESVEGGALTAEEREGRERARAILAPIAEPMTISSDEEDDSDDPTSVLYEGHRKDQEAMQRAIRASEKGGKR